VKREPWVHQHSRLYVRFTASSIVCSPLRIYTCPLDRSYRSSQAGPQANMMHTPTHVDTFTVKPIPHAAYASPRASGSDDRPNSNYFGYFAHGQVDSRPSKKQRLDPYMQGLPDASISEEHANTSPLVDAVIGTDSSSLIEHRRVLLTSSRVRSSLCATHQTIKMSTNLLCRLPHIRRCL
jgi:hypothetical protein